MSAKTHTTVRAHEHMHHDVSCSHTQDSCVEASPFDPLTNYLAPSKGIFHSDYKLFIAAEMLIFYIMFCIIQVFHSRCGQPIMSPLIQSNAFDALPAEKKTGLNISGVFPPDRDFRLHHQEMTKL